MKKYIKLTEFKNKSVMMNKSNLWTSMALLMMLSACASFPTDDRELSNLLDIQEQWQAQNGLETRVENGWLDDFEQTSLSDFVAEVLNNNPNYNEVALRMQAAGFNADVAQGRLLPRVGASASATRTGMDTPIQNTSNSFSIGLDASWEADVWGKLSANAAAARSNYEVAQYDFYGARLSLAAQVAQSWFDVIEAKQQLDLSTRTVENFERTTNIIDNRFKRGLTTGLDLRLSLSNLEDAKSTEKLRETLYRQSLRRLELFAGQYPSASMHVLGEIPSELNDVPIGVPLDILERRPDLQAAKSKLYAAGYRAQAAEKALLPSISITARGNNTSEEFKDLLKFDNVFWNLVGGITQPIFQGGQLLYAAKAERLNFEAQKQNYAQTLLRAFNEVEEALDNDKSLKERVEHIEISAQNAIAAEQVALEQYSQGLIRIATLLQSQRQSIAQQGQLISIKKQRVNNRIALYLSLGGDFTSENRNQENIVSESQNYQLGEKQEANSGEISS